MFAERTAAEAVIPLMSDTKAEFFIRRWCQTLMGGMRFCLPQGTPWFIYAAQLLVGLLPIAVGVVMSILNYQDVITTTIAMAVSAGITMLWAGLLVLASARMRQEDPMAQHFLSVGQDEDSLDFDDFWSPETFKFLVPQRSSVAETVLRICAAGAVSAAAVDFFDVSSTKDRYSAAWQVYLAVGWWTVLHVLYPTIAASPAEPNQFNASGDVPAFTTRTVMFLLCYAVDIIERKFPDAWSQESTAAENVWTSINSTTHILVVALPWLWMFGIMPPLQAFVEWSAEQCNVIVFGGTEAASAKRTSLHTVESVVCAMLVYAAAKNGSQTVTIFTAVALGVYASRGYLANVFDRDIPRAGEEKASSRVAPAPMSAAVAKADMTNAMPVKVSRLDVEHNTDDVEMATLDRDNSTNSVLSPTHIPLKTSSSAMPSSGSLPLEKANAQQGTAIKQSASEAGQHQLGSGWSRLSPVFNVALALAVFAAGIVVDKLITDTILSDAHTLRSDVWTALVFAGAVVYYVATQLSRPFVAGLVRNPLYSCHVPLAAGVSSIAASLVTCATIVYIVTQFDSEDIVQTSSRTVTLWHSVLLFRAFRTAVSSTRQTISHLAVVLLADYILEWSWWDNAAFPEKLLLAAYAIGTVWHFLRNLQYASTLTFGCFTVKKQKFASRPVMALLCALLFPHNVAVILLASVLRAPMIPLLGAPLFILGCPTPLRSWQQLHASTSTSTKKDAAYYRQMCPQILHQLAQLHRHGWGALGDITSGDVFLLRLEPYIIFLEVCESYRGGCVVVAKGMELQTTSCHAVEASKVDEMVEAWFTGRNCFNPYITSAVEPLGTIKVNTYSIIKNVLTGIIDDPVNLRLITRAFPKALMVMLADTFGSDDNVFPASFADLAVRDYYTDSVSNAFSPELWQLLSAKEVDSLAMRWMPIRKIVLSCYAIVEVLGMGGIAIDSVGTGAKHVVQVFNGQVPGSLHAKYLLEPTHARLKQLTLRAYQCAVKMVYDAVVMADAEWLNATDRPSLERFISEVRELKQWQLGEVDETVLGAVASGEAKVFSIQADAQAAAQGETKYQSLSFQLRDQDVGVMKVNAAAVRSMWASLRQELLYFANDDEERYSIQAHPWLLRNLVIQTAEPPLGYPLYSSGPVSCAL